MPDDPTQPVEGIAHCPSCLGIIASQAHFCNACGMPLTMYSTVSPLEQVWAFGWFINRLLSQRPTRLALVGTWVLAIPALAGLIGVATEVLYSPGTGGVRFVLESNGQGYTEPVYEPAGLLRMLFAIPWLLMAFCYIALPVRVTLHYCRPKASGSPEE